MLSGRLSPRSQKLLAEMGIELWEHRTAPAVVKRDETAQASETGAATKIASVPQPAAAVVAETADQPSAVASAPPRPPAADFNPATADWDSLHAAIRGCQRCELGSRRTHAVCGAGNRTADWLIVGEAPGKQEDATGEPFVGRAGQLLNQMLRAVGLEREQVFIANVLKCQPPGDRNPLPAEVSQCLPYLHRQIALLQPRLILAVGAVAAHNLLQINTPVGKLRGHVHGLEINGHSLPLVVTYHPAYLLRNPVDKSRVWQDLLLALDVATGRRP